MSTMTAPATGAEAVEAARGILRRAITCPWPADAEAREAIHDAIWPLAVSLAVYGRLRLGIIRAGDAISGLEARAGALGEALDAAAEGVSSDAGGLVRVIGEQCGSEAADVVRGSKGEQS